MSNAVHLIWYSSHNQTRLICNTNVSDLIDSVKQLTELWVFWHSEMRRRSGQTLISAVCHCHLISDAGLERTCQNCHILPNAAVPHASPHPGESCPQASGWRRRSTALWAFEVLKLMGSLLPWEDLSWKWGLWAQRQGPLAFPGVAFVRHWIAYGNRRVWHWWYHVATEISLLHSFMLFPPRSSSPCDQWTQQSCLLPLQVSPPDAKTMFFKQALGL